MTNSTSAPTTPSPGGALEGNCTSDNLYFIIQSAASVLLLAAVLFATSMMRSVPSGGKQENYGRPWMVGVLLFNICLWNVLPLCVLFALFHILVADLFAMSRTMACLQILNIPFLPIMLFLKGILLLVFYFPKSHRERVSRLINNDEGLASATTTSSSIACAEEGSSVESEEESVQAGGDGCPKKPARILMLGAPTRGMFFIDALCKQKEGTTMAAAETMLLDFAHASNRPFIVNNALATGLITSEAEASTALNILEPTPLGNLKLGIPLADCSVDKVVICPMFRSMQPIGDFMTPEKEKAPRMAKLFVEALRVLKPNGTINVVESGISALLAQADLRDLGCDDVELINPCVSSGSIPFMQSPHYHIKWTKTKELEPSVAILVEQEQAPLSRTFAADETEMSGPDDSPLMEKNGSTPPPAEKNYTARTVVVCTYQLFVFVLLLVIAAVSFKGLDVPTDIVPGSRVGNILAQTATNYPMMCYFTRSVLLSAHHTSSQSFANVIVGVIRVDLLAIISTVLFTALFWVPQFLMQLLLDETTLSDNSKSMIGMGISMALGVLMFKFSRWKTKKDIFKARDLPEEYWFEV